MLDALYISAIGLQTQKEQLDTLANNLANLNTVAYKRQSVDFSAVLDRAPDAASSVDIPQARAARTVRWDASAGVIHATGRPLDLAIQGEGFIEVQLPDGQTGYSRGGSLRMDADGVLTLGSGQPLKADIRVPQGATDVRILPDGSVTALLPNDTNATVLGNVELVTFTNAESLQYRGDGVLTLPEGSTEPSRARPGDGGTQLLAVQSLESSNVSMTDEMVSLMLMQRIYELNSRVAQVADELMSLSNNLIRS